MPNPHKRKLDQSLDPKMRVTLAHAAYVNAQRAVPFNRARLRREVLAWHDQGATIVEIAETLSWSRQSVYDLIGDR